MSCSVSPRVASHLLEARPPPPDPLLEELRREMEEEQREEGWGGEDDEEEEADGAQRVKNITDLRPAEMARLEHRWLPSSSDLL